jgi:hypothetical protein
MKAITKEIGKVTLPKRPPRSARLPGVSPVL